MPLEFFEEGGELVGGEIDRFGRVAEERFHRRIVVQRASPQGLDEFGINLRSMQAEPVAQRFPDQGPLFGDHHFLGFGRRQFVHRENRGDGGDK